MKKIVAMLLMVIVVLNLITIPITVSAGDVDVKYTLWLSYADVYEAGQTALRDGPDVKFYFRDGHVQVENEGHGVRGETHEFSFTCKRSPWLLDKIEIFCDSANAICVSHVEIQASGSGESIGKFRRNLNNKWMGNGDDETTTYTIDLDEKRKITDDSKNNFSGNLGGQTVYLDETDSNNFTKEFKWSGKLKDQFGEREYWKGDDPAEFKLSFWGKGPGSAPAEGKIISDGDGLAMKYLKNSGYTVGYSVKGSELYKMMADNGLNILEAKSELKFSNERSIDKNTIPSGAVKFVRKNFQIGTPFVTNDYFYAYTDNYYFNSENKEVVINVPIDSSDKNSHYKASEIANNLNGIFKLKYNKTDSVDGIIEKVPGSSNVKLTFTVPGGVEEKGSNLKLVIEGATSSSNGQSGFRLVDGEGKYNSTIEYNLSQYKADTKAPSISMNEDISGKWAKEHTFTTTTSESEIYSNMAERNPGNPSGNFDMIILDEGEKVVKQTTEPHSEGHNHRLYVPDGNEGIYSVKLKLYDYAGNSDEKIYTNILMDNKPPEVSISTKINERASDKKTAEFQFNINEGTGTGRVKYCFVKRGDDIPSEDNSEVETGTFETTIGRWGIINQSDAGGVTALLTLEENEFFDGTIYYYAEDASGNISESNFGKYFEKEIFVDNSNAECDISIGAFSYPQSEYDIKLSTPSTANTIKYQWEGVTPLVTYTGQEIGAKTQKNSSGNTVTLDGEQTLKYTVTTKNGASNTYSKKFVFDNSDPEISITQRNSGTVRTTQKYSVDATDISGIKEATYKVTSYSDDTVYEEGTLGVVNGILDTEVILSGYETGAYKISVTATDYFGRSVTETNGPTYIRNGVPQAKAQISFTERFDKYVVANSKSYYIDVEATENVIGSSQFPEGQIMVYRTSHNGDRYTEWAIGGSMNAKDDDTLKGTFVIDNPAYLTPGENTITIQVACINGEGEIKSIVPEQIYTMPVIDIFCDEAGPEYEVTFTNEELTNKDVYGTVVLYDEITESDGLTLISEKVGTDIIEISEAKFNEFTGKKDRFDITVKNSVETELTAKDKIGNITYIPIKISCIDKEVPTVILDDISEYATGARQDANINVRILGTDVTDTKFTMVPKGTTDEDLKNNEELFSTPHLNVYASWDAYDEEYVEIIGKDYALITKGLAGTYNLGVYAKDKAGNEIYKVLSDGDVALTYPAIEITGQTEERKNVALKTSKKITFNVPVYVLPQEKIAAEIPDDAPAGEYADVVEYNKEFAKENANAFSTEYTLVASANGDYEIYAVDDCGSVERFVVSISDVTFAGGSEVYSYNMTTYSYFPGQETESEIPIDMSVMNSDGVYDETRLYIQVGSGYSNITLKPYHDIYTDGDDFNWTGDWDSTGHESLDGYTELVFSSARTDNSAKTVSFNVYEYDDDGNLLIEYMETININCLDSTLPKYNVTYDDLPAIGSSLAHITARDYDSGVKFLGSQFIPGYFMHESLEGPMLLTASSTEEHDQYLTYEQFDEYRKDKNKFDMHENTENLSVKLTQNGLLIFWLENGVGGIETPYVNVRNIVDDYLEYGEDYTVSYERELNGAWVPVSEGDSYKNVKAVVTITEEGKKRGVFVENNGGDLEKVLTPYANTFTFRIKDKYGCAEEYTAQANSFDLKGAQIAIALATTDKTNKDVMATITADDENGVAKVYFYPVNGSKAEATMYSEGVYTATVTGNGTYVAEAIDAFGNVSKKNILVSNIDKAPPVVSDIILSTSDITSSNVTAKIVFSKDDVTITKIEIPDNSQLSASDITFSATDNTIIFSKNGTVGIYFEDSFGNKDSDIVTVTNIYKKAPSLEAVAVPSEDKSEVMVTFKQQESNGIRVDILRELEDITVFFRGVAAKANEASFILTENGDYDFMAYDDKGLTQHIKVTVSEIDNEAPVITQVSWAYEYEELVGGTWTKGSVSESLTPGSEAGYVIATDKYNATNRDVTVTVKTDKPTSFYGTSSEPSTENSLLYDENGMFNFNMQSSNKLYDSYAFDVEVIDKTPPVITYEGADELMFIEGRIAEYNPDIITKFTATDKGETLSSDYVSLDLGGFDVTDINNNVFDKNKPYEITYKAYDKAGNYIEKTRTIRLIGMYDTIALVNGIFPDPSGSVILSENEFTVSYKNFEGISYVRYAKGTYSSGQMKTRGTMINENNGTFTVSNLEKGWYTVYIQTDKRDYFNLHVYVGY